MEIVISASALASLKKAQKSDRTRVLDAIQQVADSYPQRLSFVTEMVGTTGLGRLRKGDWRVVYEITNDALTVRVVAMREDAHG